MKTFFVFFLFSISAFSAPLVTPSSTELKVRQIWANHYKTRGYDFDIQKMSEKDMDKAFRAAELSKELDAGKKVQEEKAEAARKSRAAANKLEQEKTFESLTPEEKELIRLEAEEKRLLAIYKNERSAVNQGRWSEALHKMTKLKRKLYPSLFFDEGNTRRTTLEDLEGSLDEIKSKFR